MNNKNNYNKNFIIIYFKNLFFGFSIHISWAKVSHIINF